MIASSHRSRRSATGCTGDVCGSERVLVLPVTPEITAAFVAAAEAAPAKLRGAQATTKSTRSPRSVTTGEP